MGHLLAATAPAAGGRASLPAQCLEAGQCFAFIECRCSGAAATGARKLSVAAARPPAAVYPSLYFGVTLGALKTPGDVKPAALTSALARVVPSGTKVLPLASLAEDGAAAVGVMVVFAGAGAGAEAAATQLSSLLRSVGG